MPDLPGVLSAPTRSRATAEHLASLQLPSGMIPWFPGGHCDPWNHVESAMALDVAGLHDAGRGRPTSGWPTSSAPTAAGTTTTCPTARVEEAKLDTNVCAYIATGVWHHWRCTGDRGFVDNLWPTVERALDWVLSLRRADGLVLWAIEADGPGRGTTPCSPASSSIQHALRCGAAARRRRRRAARRLGDGRRRDVRRRSPSARRVRAEGALGDGLVLPGADRRDHRRGGQDPARRRLGRRSRWRAWASAASATSRGSPPRRRPRRARLRRDRRPRHGHAICCAWTRAPPPRRRLVRDRHRLPRQGVVRSPPTSTRRTRRRR